MKEARPYLVFVRAGAASLHQRLIAEDNARNWDCCVSWYCETPPDESIAETYIRGGTNKFEAFARFYAENAEAHNYRYVLLLDDDILFAPGDVSRFFAHCARYDLYLSQPALCWGTYANHDVTLRNPLCIVRRTRFVEVMAPCFSRAALTRLLPTFRLNRSTWGIDYAWASLLAGEGKLSIVDAVCVQHTKAVDFTRGAFYRKLKAEGVDPLEEYRQIKSSFPRFGSLATERTGHRPRWPLPGFVIFPLVRLLESVKKRIHRILVLRRRKVQPLR